MATTARQGEPTLEEFLANAEAGIFDDRREAFLLPDLTGPLTADELPVTARRLTDPAGASQPTGRTSSTRPRKRK